jgi:hypothetical protein
LRIVVILTIAAKLLFLEQYTIESSNGLTRFAQVADSLADPSRQVLNLFQIAFTVEVRVLSAGDCQRRGGQINLLVVDWAAHKSGEDLRATGFSPPSHGRIVAKTWASRAERTARRTTRINADLEIELLIRANPR